MRYPAAILVSLFSAGCSTGRDNASPDTQQATSPARIDSAPGGSGSPTTAWTVTPGGIGAIRTGMTTDELRRVAGDFTAPTSPGCAYVRPASVPPGVSVMLADGRVARIDIDSAGVRTDAGVSVGDSSATVSSAYQGRVTTMLHKYVTGGEYLNVRPASPGDSTLRIVFESEAGRVTRYRTGRVPEVEWVERCG